MKVKKPVALCSGKISQEPISSDTHTPREYYPWAKRPSTEECADDLSAPDIDKAWPQSRHAIPSAHGVGRDVRAQRTESERKGREEGGRAVVPVIDEPERVPDNLTVQGDTCTCHGDTDKADQCECNRDSNQLDILSTRIVVSVVERVDL